MGGITVLILFINGPFALTERPQDHIRVFPGKSRNAALFHQVTTEAPVCSHCVSTYINFILRMIAFLLNDSTETSRCRASSKIRIFGTVQYIL